LLRDPRPVSVDPRQLRARAGGGWQVAGGAGKDAPETGAESNCQETPTVFGRPPPTTGEGGWQVAGGRWRGAMTAEQ
jgi:hypothetical protein